MTYDTAKIRQFLNQSFDDEDLKQLCFDYFPDVLRDFTSSMTFKQKVQLLLEHCQKYQRFPHLLAALEKERPTVYPTAFPTQSTIELVSTVAHRNPQQVFISYAHQDSDFAHQLAEDLQAQNIPVWIAPESIHPGEKWVAAINRGLEESGVFLLTLTPNALTSQWVQDETNAAIELQKEGHIQFIPLLVKPCSPPPLWRVYQRIPFDKEYQAGLRVLLSRLGIRVTPPPSSSPSPSVNPNQQLKEKLLRYLRDPVWQAIGVFVALASLVVAVWAIVNPPGTSHATPFATLTSDIPLKTPTLPIEVVQQTITIISMTATNAITATPEPTETTRPGVTSEPTRLPTIPPSATPVPTATFDPNIPPPNAQLGDTWTRPTDGMVMVYVPAGTFLMGSADNDPDANDDEKPQHEVTLDGFWIDRTEVTNDQYSLCVQAGVCEASVLAGDSNYNGDNYPVVGVSWNDADAYCQWAGGSLPTEAQWEYAARGPENRIYPWGDEFDGTMLNFCDNHCTYDWKATTVDDGYELTAPVGSYPGGQSWVGAVDMAGNVWEWVADWYDANYYSSSLNQDPLGPETGSNKVLRGGSWSFIQPYLRAALRIFNTPVNRSLDVGFRCLLRPGN